MIVRSLQINGFRNLATQRVEFASGVNLLLGANGQGKTNFLESIHVLSALRSFRQASAREMVGHELAQASICGQIETLGLTIELRVLLEKGHRRLWIGGKAVHSVRDYLGQLKVVAFTPDDLSMVKGAPGVRRRFLDRVAFLFFPEHLGWVREMNTSLKARNQLLRARAPIDDKVVDSFSETLAHSGAQVTRARNEVVRRIGPGCARLLGLIEGGEQRLAIAFRPGFAAESLADPQRLARELLDALRRGLPADLQRRQTQLGPQLDDFSIQHGAREARRYSSQGEQRSCALALLLAVVEQVVDSGAERPVIVLDDVSSELDAERRRRMFAAVLRTGAQVLVTTTDEALVADLAPHAARRFTVRDGLVLAG